MRSFFLDLSCAFRTLRKTPVFTFVVAGILALGIAFNAIVFSVVNFVLLRPLPYPEADKLVILQAETRQHRVVGEVAAPTFFFVQQHATSLEDVSAIYPIDVGVNLAGAGTPTYVRALRVSHSFFRALRTVPLKGRTFTESEDDANGPHVVVLSYSLWKRNFSQDHSGLGAVLRINGEQYTTIGVMPRTFRSYPEADLWLPLQLSAATANAGTDYRVIARVRAGISLPRSREELLQLSAIYPLAPIPAAVRQVLTIQGLQDYETRDLRDRLRFLLSAVFLVLLIACANIAMLLLVRTSARAHEIAIRVALGSPRGRLVQVFFLEGALFTLLGGLFGIILAKELLPLVLSQAPSGIPFTGEIHIDWSVAAFTLGVCGFAAVIFGLVPIANVARFELNEILEESTFRASASPRQARTGRLLLVTQIALTLILLSASILLLNHLLTLKNEPPGFDTSKRAVVQVSLAARQYQTTAPTALMLENLMQKLKGLPFVEEIATINGLPLEEGLNMPMRPGEAPHDIESAEYRLISPDYFGVMHISLLQGRPFAVTDGAQAQPVAIVNETLARKWWPDANAIGHFVVVGEAVGPDYTERPRVVVGVTTDVRQSSLDLPARPTVFVPMQQAPDKLSSYVNKHFLTSIVVRTTSAEDITERVRNAVETADPDLSVASLRPLSQVVANSLTRERFYAFLTVAFGGFALLITAVGLYGLMSYQVGLRTREIAVRMSVGAQRSQVVMMVVWQGVQLTLAGILIGIAGSFLFRRVFAGILYNLQSVGLAALANAILLVSGVAALASLLTAFRIASIDPMVVLRNE
jgi:predicted permease